MKEVMEEKEMKDLLHSIYQERVNDANTLGILVIEKMKPNSPITDNFDRILLIIVEAADVEWRVKHYEFEVNKTAAMHVVTNDLLKKWIETSGYRKAIAWLVYGEIIFDRNAFVVHLQKQLQVFPTDKRNLRKTIEFGKLLRSFTDAKDLFESGQYKDAYSRVVHSLHYLARLAVIENGYHPEIMVWDQVKQIDREVYKLYDELIESDEELNKRVQLMLIAADYVINNRAKKAAQHLLTVLQSREGSWTYEELVSDTRVAPYSLNLTAMIAYLIEKNILQTELTEAKIAGIYHRTYQTNTGITIDDL